MGSGIISARESSYQLVTMRADGAAVLSDYVDFDSGSPIPYRFAFKGKPLDYHWVQQSPDKRFGLIQAETVRPDEAAHLTLQLSSADGKLWRQLRDDNASEAAWSLDSQFIAVEVRTYSPNPSDYLEIISPDGNTLWRINLLQLSRYTNTMKWTPCTRLS